jgi:NTE family protein
MKYRALLVVLVVAFAKAELSKAQSIPAPKKQKIGLVLSGGGAKGLAHVGALKVIDSLGIKIDYVAGTSMGAIIGSLYASGYTGKQLDSIIKRTDFNNIVSDDIPRSAKTIKEREDTEKYAVTLPFKDFKIQLPSSLSKGQNVYNLLSRLLAHVKDVDDFSKLPIPFICIATDVENGEEVVLESGDLPKAVNASGALPSLFAPVEINGRLLIDGGVTDNYPIIKLMERSMDVIIGVDVQEDFKTRSELASALDILSQINNFRTINDMKVKAPLTDVYIVPDISSYSVVSFDKGTSIIKSGSVAALEKLDQLKLLATDSYQRQPLNRVVNDSIYVTSINTSGNDSYSRAYILGRFKIKTPVKVAYMDISNGINNLQATNNFSKINYELNYNNDGSELELELIESDVRNYLHLGLHYDELFKSAALVNLTRKSVLFADDKISADLIIGDNIRYNIDYFIDKGRYWSVGIHSDYIRFQKDVSVALIGPLQSGALPGINSIDLKYREWNQRLYFQTRLEKKLSITTGLEIKSQNIFTETLITANLQENRTTFDNSSTTSLYGSVLYDSYDDFNFANTGWKIKGNFQFYAWNTDFDTQYNQFSIAQLEVGRAVSYGKLSLKATGNVGVTIGYPNNASFNFFLGGYGNRPVTNFISFYGYDFISITGDSMIKFLVDMDYEIFPKNHLSFHVNLASVDDKLFDNGDWITKAQYTGYALGYGVDTFLGPVEVKYSFSPQQNDAEFFVVLGFRF